VQQPSRRIEPEATETDLGSVGIHGIDEGRATAAAYCGWPFQNVSGAAKDLSPHSDDDGGPYH
jgi:hypothetical protein